jgi:hypothetical protein
MAARRVLLDTNLLLLWLVGRTDAGLLSRFKRVHAFDPPDIPLLEGLIGSAEIVTTPHILAETSNFVDQAPQFARAALVSNYRAFARTREEVYREARAIVLRQDFERFGLTDSCIADLSQAEHVITADYRLAGKIQASGGSVTNFNHARQRSFQSSPRG